MKKLITILLVVALVLGLCACGGSGEGKKEDGKKENMKDTNATIIERYSKAVSTTARLISLLVGKSSK